MGDLGSLRAWTAQRLRSLGVWMALVSAGQQRTAFARAASGLPGWQVAYVDAEHSMFVDAESAAGRALVERIDSGTARFPEESIAKLTAAFRLLPAASEDVERRAVTLAEESYRDRPTSLAVIGVTRAARTPAVAAEAMRFCRDAAQEFVANRDRHRAESGYSVRLDAAVRALEYVAIEAKKADQTELLRWASAWLTSCRADQDRVAEDVLW
jgi:hypothetical protein